MRKSQSQFVKYYSILPVDPPRITQHPKDQSVATGADASFYVEATGDNLTFQWQKNHSDLDDGERCCGTRTNRLRIIEVEMSDKGRYRCLVKNSVGDEFSQEAFLSKLVMCSSTLGSGLEKDEHVQTYGFDLLLNKSPWYLSAEPPTTILGTFQPTGQFPYPVGSQYPSPQHLSSGSGWKHQTFDPFQPPPQGIRVCI